MPDIPQAEPVDVPDEQAEPVPLVMVLHGPLVINGTDGTVTVYRGQQFTDLDVIAPPPAEPTPPEQETTP